MEQLTLLDMQGRVLQQWQVESTTLGGSQALDLSRYPAGTYILQATGVDEQLSRKLVKK